LFTADTKAAVDNCKDKARYLSDPLPLEKMYDKILPNPNSTHQLTEYLSLRGESKLEAFHDRFAHFANCGMRASLADNLNLAGTARYNLFIRHKRSMTSSENPIKNPWHALSIGIRFQPDGNAWFHITIILNCGTQTMWPLLLVVACLSHMPKSFLKIMGKDFSLSTCQL